MVPRRDGFWGWVPLEISILLNSHGKIRPRIAIITKQKGGHGPHRLLEQT